MAGIIPTAGENRWAALALNEVTHAKNLHLYVNDYTPVDASVLASFTEMTGHGYAAKVLAAGSWVITQVSGKAQGQYAQQSFMFTAGGPTTVYGYYITDDEDDTVLAAERFVSPRVIENDGDEIRFTPKIRFSKEA